MKTPVALLACSLSCSIGSSACDDTRRTVELQDDAAAGPPDLRASADLGLAPDLARAPDLALPPALPDLASPPDLTVPADLATVPDLNLLPGDFGVPYAATLTPTTSSPTFGNPNGGNAFSDACPAGQVLIGIDPQLGGSVNGVRGLCGTINVYWNAQQQAYVLELAAGATLPFHGSAGNPATSRCPANQAIVAISGRSGQLVDGYAIECATLSLSGTPLQFGVAVGAAMPQAYVGGAGGNAFARFACNAGDVVSVLAGRAGNALDGLSLGCATPTVR